MKFSILYLIGFAVIYSSCQQKGTGLPCIDVRESYPVKEISLTDIADITYLCLHSDDDKFLYGEYAGIRSITENSIVIADVRSGDVFFFSKDGIPKSKFNRRGNGPMEFIRMRHVFYDEAADDVFVIGDTMGGIIQVYSSTGKHKREINLPQELLINNDIVSFDDHSLLFYDAGIEYRRGMADDFRTEIDVTHYYLISKEDGAILDHLELPIAPIFIGIHVDGMRVPAIFKSRLLKNNNGILLCNPENDTVFLYGKDKALTPILHKTPLAGSVAPLTYMNNCVDAGRYLFTEVFTVQKGEGFAANFPVKYYMLDKKTGEVIHPKLFLPDYRGYEFVIKPSRNRQMDVVDYFFDLDLTELKQAYRENRLSGKLKELVATLKDDDNNVFMLVNFK